MGRYDRFRRIVEVEFGKIVSGTDDFGYKLRIYFIDRSYLDLFVSTQYKSRRFSFHWERRHLDNAIYRLDNTPDPKWKKIDSFPLHFHSKRYESVVNSPFKHQDIERLIREIMSFIQERIRRK